MKHFKSTSLADQIFEKLENDIILGVYPRGEVLTEMKLVEQLGVSRTPIREALRRLEQERLIEDTGKGSRVLGITEEDLLDILTIRERIEGVAAYYATKNMTDEGRAELNHLMDLQDFYYQKGNLDQMQKVDDQLHDAICYLSKRTVIVDTLVPLHRKTRRYRRLSMSDPERVASTRQEHAAICHAMLSGDAALAEEMTRQHISNVIDHMLNGRRYNG